MAERRGWMLRASALAITMMTAAPAMAQQSARAAGEAVAQTPAEIIVTAQKREQNLQDVPISIAVVSGIVLEERSIATFEELSALIPNFTVTKSPAANVIAMRGIASSAGSPSLEQSVVMFLDGIYAGNPRQFAAPFLDVERFEVLRGPQGALVGKNTSAGAINILTRRPGQELSGSLSADFNLTHGGPTLEATVNVPLSDTLSVRAALKSSDVDGYLYNTLTSRDEPERREAVGRLSLLYDAGPVTVFAKYERAQLDVAGTPLQVRSAARGRGIDYVKETRLPFSAEYDDVETDNAVVQVDFDIGGHILTSITGYSGFVNRSRIDADFFEQDRASADFDIDYDQFSQEVRVLSPTGGAVEYILGAYYQDSDLTEERTTGVLFAPPASTYRIFNQSSRVFSAYGQATVNFSAVARLQASLRYTDEQKSARYRRFTGPETYLNQRIGTQVRDFGGAIDEGLWDPAVSLQYDATPKMMIYASFSRGSKGGGFQGAISNAEPFAFAFRPERSESYEVGARTSFGSAGYLNVTAFNTRYSDLQVSVALPSPDGLSAPFFTGNAGDAEVTGVELDGQFRLSPRFSIDGGVAWTPKARYGSYPSGPCFVGQAPNGVQRGSCNLTGLRLIYTPTWSGSLTARYARDLGGSLRLSASLTALFQSRSLRDFTADPFAYQEGYSKLDARVALGRIDERWEIALVGRNLTDEKTISFSSAGGLANTFFSPDARIVVVEPPQTFSLVASLRL